MTKVQCVIHVLAVNQPETGPVKLRCTVRSGAPAPGDRFWFAGPSGDRRHIDVLEFNESGRHSELLAEGEDVTHLRNGTYLYASE